MQNILIIEDEKRVADLLQKGLEENGYQTMVAYDGAMGLRLFRSNSFHLVISDIVLPNLDGFELCKEIRKLNATLFYRGEQDKTIEGHGIGMALSQKIIHLHQGHITVHSEQNKGTTFIVELSHI